MDKSINPKTIAVSSAVVALGSAAASYATTKTLDVGAITTALAAMFAAFSGPKNG